MALAKGHFIEDCINARIKYIDGQPDPITLLDSVIDSCSRQWNQELLLDDFTIRRTKFLEQSRDGHVLLWVVVTITLSGIVLAAIQLLASYQLAPRSGATQAMDSELSIEGSKLSLKSSIVGLFILAISLAFFSIFVSKIYTIHELQNTGVANTGAPQAKQLSAADLEPAKPSASAVLRP